MIDNRQIAIELLDSAEFKLMRSRADVCKLYRASNEADFRSDILSLDDKVSYCITKIREVRNKINSEKDK